MTTMITLKRMFVFLLFAVTTAFSSFSQYVVDFEGTGEENTGYTQATVSLSGLDWQIGPEALIGADANDFKNGDRSARMRGRNGSVLEQLEDKTGGMGTISFVYRQYNNDDTQQPWAVEYSTDQGANWIQIGADFVGTSTVQTFQEVVNVEGNVRVRIRLTTTPGTSGNRRINVDDITLTDYSATAPNLTASTAALIGFNYVEGNGPATAQSFSVTGANLTGDITATAATNFEISLDSITYAATQTLVPTSGAVTGTIYTRLAAGLNPGAYNGTVVLSGGSASDVTVNLDGTVNASLYPLAHDLSTGAYSFTEWDNASVAYTYPANMRLWRSSTDQVQLTQQPEGNYEGAYNLTSASRINGLNADGLSFIATGSTGAGYPLGAVVGVNTLGKENIEVSWLGGLVTQGAGTPLPREFGLRLQYQVGQSSDWTDVNGPIEYLSVGQVDGHSENFGPTVLPASCNNQSEVYLRWVYHFIAANDGGSRPNIRLDEITIDGTDIIDPSVQASATTLSGFDQILGTPSAEQTFTVSGANLTEDITVAISGEYELSLTSGTGFTSSVSIAQTSGTVNATTIYARLNAATVGLKTGAITISSQNAQDVTVAMTGETSVLTPELQAIESLTAFTHQLGTPSSEQTVSVSGNDLEGSVTVAVSTGYEVSLTTGTGFSSSISITPTSGAVASTPVYVRLNATTVGTLAGTLTVSSQNATDVVVNLNGTTTAVPQPSTDTLLYYWHFNDMVDGPDVTEIVADYSFLPTVDGKFTYTDPVTGQRDIDRYSEGSTFNLQQNAEAGFSARVRNPSATRSLVFDVPTTGAEGIGMTYAVQRSGSGMLFNAIQYSIDGTTFISTDLVNDTLEIIGADTWQQFAFDFSSISGANNNPNFKIKITWIGNNTASNGNNRYDNISITASSIDSDVSVKMIENETIAVYPNPFGDAITINSSELIKDVKIVNLLGNVVKTIKGNGINQQIDTSDLISGAYFFIVQTVSDKTYQVKSIKK